MSNQENEAKAAALRAQSRAGDGKPEGTAESLARCAKMLNEYAPECFPANEHGQVHFVRAMMESVADEIRTFLKTSDGMIAARDEIIHQQAGEIQALRAALLPFAAAAGRPGRLLDCMTDEPLPDDAALGLGVKVAAWRRAAEVMKS